MIGVLTDPSRHEVVREFFELFKTPWEFYRGDRQYEVVIADNGARVENICAKLIVIHGSSSAAPNASGDEFVHWAGAEPTVLQANGMRLPIYRNVVTFAPTRRWVLPDESSGVPAAYTLRRENGSMLVRLGYDIFDEVSALLTRGQPLAYATMPTLELHISLIRRLIVASGATLVEIPPIPHGYRFIACVTHDVDHPSVRRHKFDHTVLGFLCRAIIGSPLRVFRRELSIRAALTNWAAAIKLPFVHLGLAKDFWDQLGAYTLLDGAVHSTFFVIPFKDRRGTQQTARSPKRRASAYGAADIAGRIRQLQLDGHEIGLHGIDAWNDQAKAEEEMAEIRKLTERRDIGVRMHWLYFDENSPAVLDRVGFDYDSSVGYNEIAGYRAGTTQVYRPLNATRLLELPLHLMDTALFLSGRQHLSISQASQALECLIDNAVQFGGVVTVNWHDRSIAPERLWRDFYVHTLAQLKSRGAWVANARDTVRWFRKRRSAEFQLDTRAISTSPDASVPDLMVRLHNVRAQTAPSEHSECRWVETDHGRA